MKQETRRALLKNVRRSLIIIGGLVTVDAFFTRVIPDVERMLDIAVSPQPSLPDSTIMTSPTLGPIPKPQERIFFVGQTWSGLANQHNNGEHYQMILNVATLQDQDMSFTGTTHYPTLQDSIISISGYVLIDLKNADGLDKWQSIPGISPASKGVWVYFTENSLVQGGGVLLNVEYYAFAHENGPLQGIWYRPNENQTNGDYSLNKS